MTQVTVYRITVTTRISNIYRNLCIHDMTTYDNIPPPGGMLLTLLCEHNTSAIEVACSRIVSFYCIIMQIKSIQQTFDSVFLQQPMGELCMNAFVLCPTSSYTMANCLWTLIERGLYFFCCSHLKGPYLLHCQPVGST